MGTDGVLLGAWTDFTGAQHILDIGTGSGLIALMAAQRAPRAKITGIDIDASSVKQAQENAAASPFADRVHIMQADVRKFEGMCDDSEKYGNLKTSNDSGARDIVEVKNVSKTDDCSKKRLFTHILSNPPYHTETLLPPDARRAAARHTADLTLSELVYQANRLLAEGGTFSLIVPTGAQSEISGVATALGLHLTRLTLVRTTATKPLRRVLMTWQRCSTPLPLCRSELVLTRLDGRRTPEHEALTKDFYLW